MNPQKKRYKLEQDWGVPSVEGGSGAIDEGYLENGFTGV